MSRHGKRRFVPPAPTGPPGERTTDGRETHMTLLARVRRILTEDVVYECRHCGTTLESELDECPYCGTRGGVVRYELR